MNAYKLCNGIEWEFEKILKCYTLFVLNALKINPLESH